MILKNLSFHNVFSRYWLPALFLMTSIPTLLMFVVLVPYGEVADEPAQALRSDALLSGQFVGQRIIILSNPTETKLVAGVYADPAIIKAALTPNSGNVEISSAALSSKQQQPWSGQRTFMEISPLAVYPGLFYLPGAVGLGIGKAFGASPYNAAILGRLANSFTYLVLGLSALLLARRARALMFGVLTVPMSLNLAASMSQDGLIIAVSVLSAALISKSWDDLPTSKNLFAMGTTWGAMAAIFCVAWAKPPYLPLAGALLLPEINWGTIRNNATTGKEITKRVLALLLIAVPVGAWLSWTMLYVSAPVYFQPRLIGPLLQRIRGTLDHTDPALQLNVLFANPIRFFTLPINSFFENPLWMQMVGVLGWLDVVLPKYLYTLWYTAAFIALFAAMLTTFPSQAMIYTPEKKEVWTGLYNIITILTFVFLAFILIYISQFLDWTTVGNAFIEGPQGRYLLPLLPFIGLAIPRQKFYQSHYLHAVLTTLVIIPSIVGLAALPKVLMQAYYLH